MDLSNSEVVHTKKEGIEYLQFKKLLEYSDVLTHAYSVGIDKNFRTSVDSEIEYEKAISNYETLCNNLNIQINSLVKTNQKHTNEIKIVEKKFNTNKPDFNIEAYKDTDGLITNKSHFVLSTTNADCILLLMFDPNKKVIANIHSGWKGTLQRISTNAVEKMCNIYGSNPRDIIVCMCPSIRKCHFEVEKDVKDLFENEFKDIQMCEIIEEKSSNKKWNIDTIQINKQILQRKGIKPENIVDSGICSVCNCNVIHSYRAEGKEYKLNTAIIGMK